MRCFLSRLALPALLWPLTVAAATVQFVVVTPDTGPDAPPRIHLASSLDGWDPGGRPVPRVAAGLFVATFELPAGTMLEYKFTRAGTWESVEKGPAGEEVPNRRLAVDADGDDRVIVVRVARWADRAAAAPRNVACDGAPTTAPATRPASTRTGTFRTHAVPAPRIGGQRRVTVWLPPGYAERPEERYPVVYFHDGNNVFDAATSFAGVEWQADETADRLIRAGRIRPAILVAIDNSPQRVAEYTAWPEPSRGGGRADAYLDFLVHSVKPLIDATYRTRPGRADTATVGSSLGGLVALYAAYRHPDVFGAAAGLSPSLFWADGALIRYVQAHPLPAPARLWFDVDAPAAAGEGAHQPSPDGEAGRGSVHVRRARELAEVLAAAGAVRDRDFVYEELPGGEHHERAWAARLDRVLIFLLGPPQRP